VGKKHLASVRAPFPSNSILIYRVTVCIAFYTRARLGAIILNVSEYSYNENIGRYILFRKLGHVEVASMTAKFMHIFAGKRVIYWRKKQNARLN